MYKNISNNISTNLFETFTGALNLAPVKVSGHYKIFVSNKLELFLDDYNNRRVKLDLTQPFLPQVANFLKTNTIAINPNKLRYGAFRENQTLSYHVPLYLNNQDTLPKYFCVTKTLNQTISDSNDLHKFSNLIKLVDIEKIGLLKIFKEIIDLYDYMLNFNWQDSNVIINGYSIIEETKVQKTFTLLNNQSNQPYLTVLNNKILNTFKNNNIIFPKFINVEFEFDYVNNQTPFNNFYGFFSKQNKIEISDYTSDILTANILDYKTKIEYNQEFTNTINLVNFIDVIAISTVIKPEIKSAQIRFRTNNISVGNAIRVIHPDNTVYFEYIVNESDIKETLRETLRTICIKATNKSGRNLMFTSDVLNNTIKIVSNIEDLLIEEYFVELPYNFVLIDKTKYFCYLDDSDIIINSSNLENLYQSVLIKNNFYPVIKSFYFDGELILRLGNNFNNSILNDTNLIEIYENKVSYLIQLKPISFLGYSTDLVSNRQYDKESYIQNLLANFDNSIPEFITAVDKFSQKNNFIDMLPYVKDNIDELNNTIDTVENDTVLIDSNHNTVNVLNMLFCTPGCTAFLTPNILNIDKNFYDNNGNLDYRLLDADKIKFHYFLIKAKTPTYLENDIRGLRYFEDKPKVTSRLILNSDNVEFCETIFLGVKYRLPQKYKNYQFAVYLDFQNESEIELNYKFEVNNLEKTIYLKINKYLDFIDLIRGGVVGNEALVDLSFFYSVYHPHNTNSEALYAFKSGGLLICDEDIPVLYQSTLLNDWKYFDETTNKWYVCLKRSFSVITPPLTQLFTNEHEQFVYVYSSVVYEGETYNYVSMTFKITGLRILTDDYLWCEDISVKFFDTNEFFMNRFNPTVINEIIDVQEGNVITHTPLTGNFYSEQNVISTIIVDATNQQFELINPNYEFSLKHNYFEIKRKNEYDEESNLTTIDSSFIFPEFDFPDWDFTDLFNEFDYESLDNVTYESKISIFDRNQLWRLIRDILKTNVKFKHSTPEQTYNLIHELLLARLVDFSDLKSIEIENNEPLQDQYIKLSVIENDENIVIWKLNESNNLVPKVLKINRYHSVYQPYFKLLANELDFQRDIITNRQDVLFNIYDDNYMGSNINATGIWNEVQGNIVSSLFCKVTPFNFTIDYPLNENLTINIIDRLKNVIPIEEAIILNKNENYISQINNNIDEYIKESYIKWLLLNTYKLDSVTNELGQKLNFELIINNEFSVILKPKSFYHTRFENAIFNFIRK